LPSMRRGRLCIQVRTHGSSQLGGLEGCNNGAVPTAVMSSSVSA
jgi:hypothetical protein